MAMRLTISDEMMESLKSHVSFDAPADVQAFVADAISVYVQLGTLAAKGNQLYLQQTDRPGAPLVSLRLPSQVQSDTKPEART